MDGNEYGKLFTMSDKAHSMCLPTRLLLYN